MAELRLTTKNIKGQSLIEVLVALGTAVIVLAAIVSSVINALNNAQFAKNQNLATQYAQEGMETIRKMRDSDWNTFSAKDGSYCLDKGSSELKGKDYSVAGCSSSGSNGQNVDSFFVRQIDIEKNSANCSVPVGGSGYTTKAIVTVSWTDSKCTDTDPVKQFCHKSQLSSCFSDFNIIPTP